MRAISAWFAFAAVESRAAYLMGPKVRDQGIYKNSHILLSISANHLMRLTLFLH